MKNLTCLMFLVALVALGCHKKGSTTEITTAPAAATEAPATATDPAKPLPPPAPYVTNKADNIVHENVAGEVNPFMSGQLRIFVQQKGRMPVSFTEFANTRLDSIPRPPEGKKWAIDAATVQVKAVGLNQ